ncbi:hypothetical protein C8F04DRAFT_1105247 [Mycena alexandri]|uniref:SnoaL-like domain-containing protein n=1 Tax=Mycena alexandri TaxID=1745969 RepID=A0AAD6SS97_9AGAR|nr:hypothetical protein C8F04DRAFT_1105247 [Mycena alexandri]
MEFPNPSPQLQTVLAFLKGVQEQNPEAMFSHLTDDVEYHWVPPGFDVLGPRIKNRKQTEEWLRGVCGTFIKDFKTVIDDYVEMPGKIVLQMFFTGDLLTGPGKYENHCMWFFHVTYGPEPKIKVVKEFFDSLHCARVWGLLPAEEQVKPV